MDRKTVAQSLAFEFNQERMSLAEYQEHVSAVLARVPDQYRDRAYVLCETGYDGAYTSIVWERPETDDEMAARLERDRAATKRNAADAKREAYERYISTPEGLAAEQVRIWQENQS